MAHLNNGTCFILRIFECVNEQSFKKIPLYPVTHLIHQSLSVLGVRKTGVLLLTVYTYVHANLTDSSELEWKRSSENTKGCTKEHRSHSDWCLKSIAWLTHCLHYVFSGERNGQGKHPQGDVCQSFAEGGTDGGDLEMRSALLNRLIVCDVTQQLVTRTSKHLLSFSDIWSCTQIHVCVYYVIAGHLTELMMRILNK